MVYQSLLPTTPPPKNAEGDQRSVHFLPFPEMRKEYFDPVIERQVQRMRAVIELGRAIRDKKTLKIKVSEGRFGDTCLQSLSADNQPIRCPSRSSSSSTLRRNT